MVLFRVLRALSQADLSGGGGGGGFPLSELLAATTLDGAQAEALRAVLSREVAVVQGPPGTGGARGVPAGGREWGRAARGAGAAHFAAVRRGRFRFAWTASGSICCTWLNCMCMYHSVRGLHAYVPICRRPPQARRIWEW